MLKIFETTKDSDRRFSQIDVTQRTNTQKNELLFEIDDSKIYQTFKGFGGAITESVGYVLSQLSEDKQTEVINSYFSQNENGYTFIRSHMNSCDFSLKNWACVEQKDETLESFSMENPNKYIIPTLKAAKKCAGDKINLLISPWSPPAWMKDNNDMNHGGKLLPQYKQLWADYFCRYIQELNKQELEVAYVTIQNEPAATQVWDSCNWTAEEEGEFAVNYLYPAFEKNNLQHIKILVLDHNRDILKDRFDGSMSVPGADKAIAGGAFHWYSGGHFENLKYVVEKYPDKEFIFTEGCIEGGPQNGKWHTGERYAHNIINDLNNGCNAWIDWNIVLNMEGGPNHVKNMCDAPILADTEKNQLNYQSSYYYIGHFSRYIKPGAVKIGSNLLIQNESVNESRKSELQTEVEATAFKNPDGSIALVLLNKTETQVTFQLSPGGKKENLFCPPRSIQTFIYKN